MVVQQTRCFVAHAITMTLIRFATSAARVAAITALPHLTVRRSEPALFAIAVSLLLVEFIDGLAENCSLRSIRIVERNFFGSAFAALGSRSSGMEPREGFREGLVKCALRGTSLTDVQRFALLWATPLTAVMIMVSNGCYWPVLCLVGTIMILGGVIDGTASKGSFLASNHEKHLHPESRTRNNLVSNKLLKLLLANGTRNRAQREYVAAQIDVESRASACSWSLIGGGLLTVTAGLAMTLRETLPASGDELFFAPAVLVFLFVGVTRAAGSIDLVLRAVELCSVIRGRNRLTVLSRSRIAQIEASGAAEAAVSIQKLRHSFPGQARQVHLDSWSVQHSEHWLIQGKNGSGKSTLLRIIAGQVDPLGGTVVCDSPIYYQQQTVPSFRGTLDELVPGSCEPGPILGGYLTASPTWKKLLSRVLPGEDVSIQVPGVPTTLSPGELQVVLFARALWWSERHPQGIVLLDEPFSALDADETKIALDCLGKTQAAVVLVGHMDASPEGFEVLWLLSTKAGS